ncbi:MAG: hypothetical protein HPY58_07940 [Firmicutes bacterium]|nr:hypothetical protein [Bacillota bacterium]
MSGEENHGEREATRAEKILAFALAIFLLIGGVRIAIAVDRMFPRPDYMKIRQEFLPESTEQELSLLRQKEEELAGAVQMSREAEIKARLDYETAREEYRTLLDRGVDDPQKREAWEKARKAYDEARDRREEAEATLNNFQKKILEPKQKAYVRAERSFQEKLERLNRMRDLKSGGFSLAYALLAFALTFWIFNLFRANPRLARYAVIGTSFLGFGALQTLVIFFKIAYPFLHNVIPVEWAISLGGSIICIAALVYLKNKFFSGEAVSRRRLWRGLCPACGFPAPGAFCTWCGAAQLLKCPQCGEETNRHLPHCRGCGGSLAASEAR